MNPKRNKIIYWIATGVVTLIVLMFVGNGIFNHEVFSKRFMELGYPAYLIYPLITVKLVGLIAIWSNRFKILKEWGYSGFLFVFILAFFAEWYAAKGEIISSSLALLALVTSYIFGKNPVKEPV